MHAGQPARVIANDFNCNVRTVERLRVRYNATNSTNDRPRCGRPQVTTARQNRLMVRQHLRNRFTRATETARQTVGTHQRPISADTVRHRLVASNLLPSCQGTYPYAPTPTRASSMGIAATKLA